jgi:outer membrane protein
MRYLKQLTLLLALLVTVLANGQTKLKFGHINSPAILQAMPELKTIESTLEAEYTKLENQLTDMQEALKTLQQEYVSRMQTNSLSGEERANMERQIQEGNQKVQGFYMQSQQSLKAKEQELKQPLFDKVRNAIQEVGAENKFLYIFEETAGLTIYKSTKSIDVAPLVKTKLSIQ